MSDNESNAEDLLEKINFIPDPCHYIDKWDHSISCPGCHYVFPCQVIDFQKYPCPRYFEHCVFNCRKYAKLALTRECDDCWSVFIDQDLYESHISNCSVIAERNLNVYNVQQTILDYSQDNNGIPGSAPDDDSGDESEIELTQNKEAWVIHVPKESIECKRFKEKISCLGCGKTYPGTKIKEKLIEVDNTELERDVIVGRRDYYNHCVFKCLKYQELNLISLCLRCNKFYLDPDEFETHKMTSCFTEIISETFSNDIQYIHKHQCPCCPKTSPSLPRLKQHIAKAHESIQLDVLENLKVNFKKNCDICQKMFFSVGGLRHHMKKFHAVAGLQPTAVDGDNASLTDTISAVASDSSAVDVDKEPVPSCSSTSFEAPVVPSSSTCERIDRIIGRIIEANLGVNVEGPKTSTVTVENEFHQSESPIPGTSKSIMCMDQIEDSKPNDEEAVPMFSKEEMVALVDGLSPITIDIMTIKNFNDDDSNQCSRCLLVLADLLSLKIHFLDKHFNSELDCTNCNASFETTTALIMHFIESHEYSAKMIVKKAAPKGKRIKKPMSLLQPKIMKIDIPNDNQNVKTESNEIIPASHGSGKDYNPEPDIADLSMADDNYCLGCKIRFPQTQHISALYHHCIYECEEYSKLGLKRACLVCRGMFMNQQLLDEHKLHFCQVIHLD